LLVGYYPPPVVKVVSEEGLSRIVEYAGGVHGEQYLDVDSGE
jgi:hypothetical protein